MDSFLNIFNSVQAVEGAPSLMADPSGFLQHYGNIAVEKSVFFVPKILIALIILWIGTSIAKRLYRGLVNRAATRINGQCRRWAFTCPFPPL